MLRFQMNPPPPKQSFEVGISPQNKKVRSTKEAVGASFLLQAIGIASNGFMEQQFSLWQTGLIQAVYYFKLDYP
jgi:hypothetical protein